MAKGRSRGRSTRVDLLIGQRLRSARRLAGISQADLAAAAGVTFQQIQKYEKGTNRIAASRLLQFSIFFGRPVDWFLTGAREILAEAGLSAVSPADEQSAEYPAV